MSTFAPADRTIQREQMVLETVRRFWGYDRLRPLQKEAIDAALEGRDSLVVLPTGGGKSLCYQVPPLIRQSLDVVVSPLISLMKDQVDALQACGYPATSVHSGMNRSQKREALDFLRSGRCRLALVSPERLLMPEFLALVERLGTKAFSVDEAHCISHWGHDFRPEYRQLSVLKERFSGVALHAYTATATGRVRTDIVQQLGLQHPELLVGHFDRPNLVYRVLPRQEMSKQVMEAIQRHSGEAAIVYCITRSETERVAEFLKARGVRSSPYHAGLSAQERRSTQEAFSNEDLDVVVATVAFGMGIDRGDVRCVIHAGMPKSIEHYQQETGRAGRDGLEAECLLLYSPADVLRWKSVIDKSAFETRVPERVRETSLRLLEQMRAYSLPGGCRHKSLVEYFGQVYAKDSCGACDVCLGESEELEDATLEARKILSCVVRLNQRFGVGHLVDVLRGSESDRIKALGHDRLSTFGILPDAARNVLINKVFQLVDLGLLSRTNGEYPVIRLSEASAEVLRGERRVWLMPVRTRRVRKTKVEEDSWKAVDRRLFERLRELRSRLARERGIPPYMILGDRSLREMARLRPDSRDSLLLIHGIGEKKLHDFGDAFLAVLSAAANPRNSRDESAPEK